MVGRVVPASDEQEPPGDTSEGVYGTSGGRKRLNDILGVPTAARQAKAKAGPKAKAAPAGQLEASLAAIANFGLDEQSASKILADLECEGLHVDALRGWKLITLVNALNVDDFGNRDEWVAAYADFNLDGRQQQIPARKYPTDDNRHSEQPSRGAAPSKQLN